MDTEKMKKYVETVLYVLDRAGGMDQYHLYKVLYFAQQRALKEYGVQLLPDKFYALQYGPVPTMLYDAVKQSQLTPLNALLGESVTRGGDAAGSYLFASRVPNMDYLSRMAVQILDWAVDTYGAALFRTLVDQSHTPVWETAFRNPDDHEMHPLDIAREAGASPAVLAQIENDEQFNLAFQCN